MCYQQQGFDFEKPYQYLLQKQQQQQKVLPIYPTSAEVKYALEVADLWLHSPSQWAAHINITQCQTLADLIKLAADQDDQLQASSINNHTYKGHC